MIPSTLDMAQLLILSLYLLCSPNKPVRSADLSVLAHLSDGETEAQRGSLTYPKPPSQFRGRAKPKAQASLAFAPVLGKEDVKSIAF